MPRTAKIVLALLGILGLSHVFIPIYMADHAADLAALIAANHPEFGAGRIADAARIGLRSAVVFHAVLLIAFVVAAVALARRYRRSRPLITVISVVSLVSSAVSWNASPMFHEVIIVSDLLLFTIVATLWASGDISRFLGGRSVGFPRDR